ncbi:MAG: nucleotide exchange factor GrpE [bacterium]
MTEDMRDAAHEGPRPETVEPAAVEPATEEPATDAASGAPVAAEPDYKDRWLRAEAELQNTRRRAARDRDDAVRAAEDRVLLDVIEVLDDLERALGALDGGAAEESWTQGVVLTAQRMRDALARRGVTVIEAQGRPFDPTYHEALLEVPAPEGSAPGSVVQVVQKGYARGERALRAARVVVARMDG